MLDKIMEFFQKLSNPKPRLQDNVHMNDEEIVREISDGTTERVRWDELRKVTIITTDQGPFLEDVFFILESSNSGALITHDWATKIQLLEQLEKLPNFNFEQVIKAMTCTDNNSFLCWEKI